MEKSAFFSNKLLPYLLLVPQLIITFVFFYWPASQAVWQSFLREDAFGLSSEFIGLENYQALFAQPEYYKAILTTLVFSTLVAALSLSIALLFATQADKNLKAAPVFKVLMVWPYAVAPAVAGVLWFFMFHPSLGTLARPLRAMGFDWNPLLNGNHAMILVVMAAVWKQISYNFLFFLAGLQSIPKSVLEAGAIDGAGPMRRFWTITFPLLSPTTFFLLVVNVVYVFFDTFGIIDAVTGGGPAGATTTMVYTYAGLIMPLIASATGTLLFRQFFMTIPEELLEASRIDGAGPFRFFWDTLLPLSVTTIAALFVIQFIYGWNQYLWPLLITTQDSMQTIVIGIKKMLTTTDELAEWQLAMATAVLAMLPPVAVVVFMQRLFVRGLVETEKGGG